MYCRSDEGPQDCKAVMARYVGLWRGVPCFLKSCASRLHGLCFAELQRVSDLGSRASGLGIWDLSGPPPMYMNALILGRSLEAVGNCVIYFWAPGLALMMFLTWG